MTDQPSAPSDGTVTWHALTPQAALERQGVTVEHGLTQAEADARRAKYGPNKFAEPPKEPRWQAFLRQYRDPMQIVLLAAGVLSLFLPGQVATGVVLIGLTLLNAAMGLNQEGKANASVAALQKMMVVSGQGPPRRLARPAADGGARARATSSTSRPATSSRPTARILTAATLEIDESALTGESVPVPKQVEAVAADAGARRPGRPGLHEHPGDARRGHDPRDQHRHGHRGRPHQRHAPGDEGRGHAADPSAQRADQPDPRHRRRRAADLDRHRPVAEHPDRRAVPDRDRVRRVGHPDRPAGGGHGDPVEGDDDARRGRRHREAAALGRDARLDLGDQLRQDRHADAQPDDRRPDGRRPRSLRDHRRGLLHRGPDHPRGRPGRGTAGCAPAADGAVRRRRDPRRRAGRRPDRGRARRPRREGRGRPDPHPRALPARRDAARSTPPTSSWPRSTG